MPAPNNRIHREKRTVAKLIAIYCHREHGTRGTICQDCQDLLEYAWGKLDRCRFGDDKPTCARCTIHCYQPAMRRRVIEAMRRARLTMFVKYPWLSILHLIDTLRSRDGKPQGRSSE